MIRYCLYKMLAGFCRLYTNIMPYNPSPIDHKQVKRMLIIFTHGIGDMVMFLPTLRMVSQKMPNCEIDIVRAQSNEFLLGDDLKFHQKYNFNEQMGLKGIWKLISQLRKRKYDLSLVGVVSPGIEDAAFLSFLSGAKKRIGPTNRPVYTHYYKIKDDASDISQNMEMVKTHLQFHEVFDERPSFKIDQLHQEKIRKEFNLEKDQGLLIGIHPGSQAGDLYKRWPKEHFVKLIDHLYAKYSPTILLFEGPDEKGLATTIAQLSKHDPIIVKDESLLSVTALIGLCDVMMTSDSGLGHMAAAVNVPVVTISGPANPMRTAPYGNWEHVVSLNLACQPCYHTHGRCFRSRQFCLEDIVIDDVVKVVDKIVKARREKREPAIR